MSILEETSKQRGEDGINLALLTDGLRSEREQGITIDVAYRYYATPKRKFILSSKNKLNDMLLLHHYYKYRI